MTNILDKINQGQIAPLYLFYGEEMFLIDEAVRAIVANIEPGGCSEWNRDIFGAENVSPAEVVTAARLSPFLGGRRLVIVRNIPWLLAGEKSKEEDQTAEAAEKTETDENSRYDLTPLVEYINDPNPDCCLVMTIKGSPDKRRSLFKAINKVGSAVEFVTPKGGERNIWLNKRFTAAGKTAKRSVIDYIGMVAGDNLSFLAMEADKLIYYCYNQDIITLADAQAVISQNSTTVVFALTDAAAAKNSSLALQILRQLLQQEPKSEQKLLALLATQFRNMLCVSDMRRQGYANGDISSKLALHPYVVEKCATSGHYFTVAQLIKALDVLLAVDIAGKSGGGEWQDLLEIALLRICAFPIQHE